MLSFALTAASLASLALAFPSRSSLESSLFPKSNLHPKSNFVPRSDLYPRAGSCSGNTATTRTEWCDYDISTDYYNTVPDTGVTREYWLEITDVTVAPDGVSRKAQAVNGSIPGPTLFADWGDEVIVHVTNSLTTSTNGTSLHFHGIRQNYTNQMDGVSSITQCPTAPGSTYTYKWRATQYGSTWYHSHWALQAWEGVFGGIVINGPATANYENDLGHVFLNDWDHSTVDELYSTAETSGPPTLDNGLINGTNVYGDDDDSTQTGYRFNVSFTSGSTYRMRLVNAAIDTHWRFMIDNHTLTVIAMDLVPIEPFNTTVLSIGMGQRYDIIVTADQADTASNFWMRAIPQIACSDNDSTDNIKGIVYYGDSPSTPSTSAYSYTDSCDDMDVSDLVPYLSKTVESDVYSGESAATVSKNSAGLFKWYLNSTTMAMEWDDPTLLQIYEGATSYNSSEAVVKLDTADEWAYLVIETTLAVPHPIHLHGFDFYVLAQGSGTYSSDSVTLSTSNPPRRDTAMLPSSGYLVIAFQADNPGAWLCHCHIGWHTSEGFAMQFIVQESAITDLIDDSALSDTCSAWTTYADEEGLEVDDSGV